VKGAGSLDRNTLLVLQVLQQLTEGLAITVLAMAPADIDHQLSILPVRFHSLVIDAAFPAIRQYHALVLDNNSMSWKNPSPFYSALFAAITGSIVLRRLKVQHVPDSNNECLLQLILIACKSASDIALDYESCKSQQVPGLKHIEQLCEVLTQNPFLTSLELSVGGPPHDDFTFDSMLAALTNLQSLSR
jgi:hypothetical protein